MSLSNRASLKKKRKPEDEDGESPPLPRLPTIKAGNTTSDLTKIGVRGDELHRISKLSRKCRAKLAILVAVEENTLTWAPYRPGFFCTFLFQLGAMEGCGLLSAVAAFDLDGDGNISREELSAFQVKGETLVDAMGASVLNYSVISALLLTIYISLFAMHTGENAYNLVRHACCRSESTAATDRRCC